LTVVRVHEDESFETALRKFRHKCKKAGIFAEVRTRRYHEKPSARKRRKILSAKR
jgi:small subunit ribosomal protein S21